MSRLDLFRGAVADKFPVVRESLRESLERGGARAEQLAEWILGIFAPMVPNGEHDLAAAFARMVMKLNRAQLRYEMTGAYPERGVEDVHETVYGDTEGMTAYMLGLACSQFAWTNHFQLWCFYEDRFLGADLVRHVVEIAPGHGLFGVAALKRHDAARLLGVDISAASVALSRKIAIAGGTPRAEYTLGDAMALPPSMDASADMVICGELLEHVPDPAVVLDGVRRIMKPGGRAYVTAAITAAAPDHIVEFLGKDELLELARSAGLSPVDHLMTANKPMTDQAKGPPRTLAMILAPR